MADMVDPDSLAAKLAKLPPMPVVTYVNSTAAVKALSTICCTSANVVRVVNSLPEDEILMTPDRNLALYAASQTNKKIQIWEGYCPTHDRLTPGDVKTAREKHPGAVFIAHPECRPEVLALADAVESTSGMLRYVRESNHRSYIVGTETGLLYSMKKDNPGKEFFPASEKMVCPNMKRISLDDVERSLADLAGEVKVPEDIRRPALQAVQKMLDLSK